MTPSQPVIDYFNQYLPLSEAEQAVIHGVFEERRIQRRQFILQEGDVCLVNTFVVEGCFRMYMMDLQGKEHNLQFAVENSWIGDIGSFHSEAPSQLSIVAMENSRILQINKPNLLRLFVEYPKFNRLFRVFTENDLVSAQRRILQNISSTAEERYLDFIKHDPQLFNRISNVQVASYLGVTPEFLSTIRQRLAKS